MFSLFIWGKLAAGAASPPYGEGMMEIELDRVLLGRRVAVHRIRPVGIHCVRLVSSPPALQYFLLTSLQI